MSERDRQHEYRTKYTQVDFYMRKARNSQRDVAFMEAEELKEVFRKHVRLFVSHAREANRQAVRLWWRLDEKEKR